MRLPFAARRRLCSSANPSLRPELLREDAVLFEEVLAGLMLLAVDQPANVSSRNLSGPRFR